MAKIVYGLSGEGSGHSSRSREMITHLVHLGHEVKAVSYDRGYHNLKDDFDVFETEGLHKPAAGLYIKPGRLPVRKQQCDQSHAWGASGG